MMMYSTIRVEAALKEQVDHLGRLLCQLVPSDAPVPNPLLAALEAAQDKSKDEKNKNLKPRSFDVESTPIEQSTGDGADRKTPLLQKADSNPALPKSKTISLLPRSTSTSKP